MDNDQVVEYRLVLATDTESQAYENAGVFSGLDTHLGYLCRDTLAGEQRKQGRSSRYDHVHLSVADNNPRLVQWCGRSSTGYHYPIGRVMKMIPARD